MTKTTFLGYVPSLKSKHEATIVNGRAMKSKGGSIRYLLEGEYDGRKTLPKTVSKEDFVKVYGFDAKEAEAVIITGTKDGFRENKLFRVGKTKSDGFTPKLIEPIDKEAVEKIEKMADNHQAEAVIISGTKNGDVKMRAHKIGQEEKDGFVPVGIMPIEKPQDDISEDAKEFYENHADTVGNPSPADVEPPAPSEKPFPQEPSNENFSAEEGGFYQLEVKYNMEDGWEHYGDYDDEQDAINAYYDIYLEHPEVKLLEVDAEGDGDVIYTQRNYDLDVKEALGLFGKKDEKEEEKEEPKTQEFTVVLQEGDKLELTDIEEENEEEQEAPDDENTEKEAETLEITDIDWETDDEDVDLPASVLVPSSVVEDEIADYLSDEYGFLVRGYVLNAETYEAVQAKVTRPVKEDESKDEEESDEGLSTGAKVALGVGALAAGVALFSAEEDDYDPYESETDYSRIYEASGSGEIEHDMIAREEKVMYEFRYDNPITTYDWTTAKETVSDEEEDYIHDAIYDEIGSEPYEGEDNFEIDVEGVGSVDVDTSTDYGDKRHYGLAAEHESESDGYTYAYTKGHKDGMDNEVVYRPSIDTDREKTVFKKILKQKAESFDNDFSHVKTYDDYRKEFNRIKKEFGDDGEFMRFKIDQLHDYCSRNVKDMMAESFEATGQTQYKIQLDDWPLMVHVDGCPLEVGNTIGKTYTADEIAQESYEILYEHESLPKFRGNTFGELRKASGGLILPCNCTINEMKVVKELDPATFKRHPNETQEHWSDTVGSPSPSGPSSTPEPAEATGSEPSNENMEAEGSNMKLALGMLGIGVGAVALLGGDRIKKIFDRFNL